MYLGLSNLGLHPSGQSAFSPSSLTGIAAWYDPSDTSTMYQDFAGTASAVDSPVALLLDKSQGLAQTEKSPNAGPNFAVATGYDAFSGTPPTSGPQVIGGNVVVTGTQILFGGPSTPVTVGKVYKVTTTFTLSGAGTFNLALNTYQFGGPAVDMGNSLAAGTYTKTLYYVAPATGNVHISWDMRSGGAFSTTLTINSCSLIEVAGNHAYQITSTARPILRQSSSLYCLEFDGVDDVLATSGAIGLSSPAFHLLLAYSRASIGTIAPITGNGRYGAGGNGTSFRFTTLAVKDYDVASVFTAGTAVVLDALFAADFSLTLRVNGVAKTAVTGAGDGVIAESALNIGGNASTFDQAKFYGGIFVKGALSASQVAQAETYLGVKAGLTL